MSSDTTLRPPAGPSGPPGRPPGDRRPQANRPPARKPAPQRTSTTGSALAMPTAAALACICASTAISGVVGGLSWLSYVVVVVAVIAATGTALRAMRVPPPLIWIGQVFVLLCLAVTLFTNSGLFVVLPGPSALHDLGVVFGQAGSEVQTGVPPVDADQPILCLVMLSLGLVAVAVDTLAVTARVPAAAGLILLCVYAVPASLDDDMLPWWSFALGAAAFTFMLAVDGVQRHQAWRGKLGLPSVATTGVAPATTALTAAGLVVALFIGGTFTLIGTVGRLPGADDNSTVTGQLGIKPFTVLSGMLDQKANEELFDVSGLPAGAPYLQALTLDQYDPGKGWVRGTQMASGVSADQRPLPDAPGQQSNDQRTKLSISGVNWDDLWLPAFGMPSSLQGELSGYRYDKDSGIIYSTSARKPGSYVEQADLTVPTQQELENAGSNYTGIDPKYLRIRGINSQVTNLAEQITSNASTEFDMVQDVYSYFRSPVNGFTYSTATRPSVTGDPLVDFLFHGKTGFCEQYASAMAVMLRVLHIPSRVAIGFTDGYESEGHQVITSADAHAWVEAYFAGYGWVTFDPTPLTDGRSQVPGFVTSPQDSNAGSATGRQNPDKPNGRPSSVPQAPTKTTAPTTLAAPKSGSGLSGPPLWNVITVLVLAVLAGTGTYFVRRRERGRRPWYGNVAVGLSWGLLVFFLAALLSWWLAVLVLVLALAAAPSAVREWRRRSRHRMVVERGAAAADAAWDEILDESWDRGGDVEQSDTIRVTANRMARLHGLDQEGRRSLQTLVGEVERSWYGVPGSVRPTPVVEESFDTVRASLHRNAPMRWQARLLPRSVVRPMRHRRTRDAGPDNSAETGEGDS